MTTTKCAGWWREEKGGREMRCREDEREKVEDVAGGAVVKDFKLAERRQLKSWSSSGAKPRISEVYHWHSSST